MPEIIIIGAGAIGRGYLPWVFGENHEYVFVDTNPRLIESMSRRREYCSYRIRNGRLERKIVQVKAAYLPEDFRIGEFSGAAGVFLNVGPRNSSSASLVVEGCECPVILCENDPATVNDVKKAARLEKVYFAVPDVITSNTAPDHLLREDPLSVVTEDGLLFIQQGAFSGLRGEFTVCDEPELKKQWTAKLFLHNTPHCVAAYLGALAGVRYVHEAMAIPEINSIVDGTMQEMRNALKAKGGVPVEFLDWYAEKELSRFRCEFLCDPIGRVAREPLRKLEREGRLIGAAQICLSQGIVPRNLLTGIAGAILFDNTVDPDHHLVFMRKSLPSSVFLTHILDLHEGEALELALREQLPGIIKMLERLPKARAQECLI